MTAPKIEGIQIGRDSQRQPVIGIFVDDLLVAQLSVWDIATLYKDSGGSLEPPKLKEFISVWVVPQGDFYGITTEKIPQNLSDFFVTETKELRLFFGWKDAISWLYLQHQKHEIFWKIFLPNGKIEMIGENNA